MRRTLFVAGFLMLLSIANLPAQGVKSHVADAKREYAAIFTHQDTPCTGPQYSTADYETCMSKELTFLQPHLDGFVAAIRGLQADFSTAKTGAGNRSSGVAIFDKTNSSWKVYRDSLCKPAYSGYDGGTGAAPAELQCLYEQDRSYVKSIADWTQLKILAD